MADTMQQQDAEEAMEPEIYKITSVNEKGDEVTIYALPTLARLQRRMMRDEYGNATQEGMMIADLPDDIREQVEKTLLTTEQ